MIIPNKFIQLDYNPTTDVLFIEWPNMHDYSLPEMRFIMEEVIASVKHYDIKKILADSRQSTITLDDETYGQLINGLALLLQTTRLEKFARLTTAELNRETIASHAASLVKDSIQYQSFDDAGVAMAWLTA
ncbi:hypothetical protein [Pontibacter flavimaris]|uniref:STAS/SEC14 domain-containing protein n=1 Tax=Pontibacter flavimaris TaxID=1797110 RepID=A0A1Q5PBL7_9BACT|nr:hypothetical protein [Pontibacter flavimaris]OKL39604.1 hypothetical protein A3841_01265 [Pontibacter flavimaris]